MPRRANAKETARIYNVLDRQLGKREYLAGALSIADLATWPWISRFEWQEMDLADYPNVERWYRAHRRARRHPAAATTCRNAASKSRCRERAMSGDLAPQYTADGAPAAPHSMLDPEGRCATARRRRWTRRASARRCA